jgi:hypothetical protein
LYGYVISTHQLLAARLYVVIAKMSLVPFTTVKDFASVLTIGRRANGTSMTAFVDPKPGCQNIFYGPSDMKQKFHVRPLGFSSDDVEAFRTKKNAKFELNLEVDDETGEFAEAARRLDAFVLKSVFDRKSELMPSKAAYIITPDALTPLYINGKFLREGSTSSDGKKYNPSIRLRVTGSWNGYVSGLRMRAPSGRATWASVDRCDWQPRNPTHAVTGMETRFFLWVKKDEKTGKDVYTDKVPTAGGELRLVGPEDCKPGCLVTPVFSFNSVYVNDGFGVSADARAIYIKPRPVEEDADMPAFTAQTLPMLADAMIQ